MHTSSGLRTSACNKCQHLNWIEECSLEKILLRGGVPNQSYSVRDRVQSFVKGQETLPRKISFRREPAYGILQLQRAHLLCPLGSVQTRPPVLMLTQGWPQQEALSNSCTWRRRRKSHVSLLLARYETVDEDGAPRQCCADDGWTFVWFFLFLIGYWLFFRYLLSVLFQQRTRAKIPSRLVLKYDVIGIAHVNTDRIVECSLEKTLLDWLVRVLWVVLTKSIEPRSNSVLKA